MSEESFYHSLNANWSFTWRNTTNCRQITIKIRKLYINHHKNKTIKSIRTGKYNSLYQLLKHKSATAGKCCKVNTNHRRAYMKLKHVATIIEKKYPGTGSHIIGVNTDDVEKHNKISKCNSNLKTYSIKSTKSYFCTLQTVYLS